MRYRSGVIQKTRVNVATESIFVAAAIPKDVATVLAATFQQYPQHIKLKVRQEKWHVTFAWLGQQQNYQAFLAALLKPMRQTYLPTLHITHVGRGVVRHQLWAYANPSVVVVNLHERLQQRLSQLKISLPETKQQRPEFVQHVHLANLYNMSRGIGIADYAVNLSFAIKELQIYVSRPADHSTSYHELGSIKLTS